jgi:hypothetical protein
MDEYQALFKRFTETAEHGAQPGQHSYQCPTAMMAIA